MARIPLYGVLLLAFTPLLSVVSEVDVRYGIWWKQYLTSPDGHEWFYQWNTLIQAKIDELAHIAESEAAEKDTSGPFQVMMAGDSTMKHQYGAMCAFLGERNGHRYNPEEMQTGPGCCVDTAEGGGRGLCFGFDYYRFLNPDHADKMPVDAYYFNSGLHLLHMAPEGDLEALRVQEWLAYDSLLESQVESVRAANRPGVRIAYMTTHIVDDTKFSGSFADIRDAYRNDPKNQTIIDECEKQMVIGAHSDAKAVWHWEGSIYLHTYARSTEFTESNYCEEGLMDRQGSIQLNRRARYIMAKMGVPIVEADRIVEGQSWATRHNDGRHYHPLVPVELAAMLSALTSPPPPPMVGSPPLRDPASDNPQHLSFHIRNED